MVSLDFIRDIPGQLADLVGVDPAQQGRVGRAFGILKDTATINVRLDKRFGAVRARFSRQETPLDFTSAVFAEFLGLPEDTITENIARVRGTNSEAAHVFLLEWARRITRDRSAARRLIDRGIMTELRGAKEKGELEISLEEILDPRRRKKLGRRLGAN